MYCEHCGSAIPKDKIECEYCGRMISKSQNEIKNQIEGKREFKRLSDKFGIDNTIQYRDDNKNIKTYIVISITIILFLIILLVGKLGG